jgi:hypothetical protein
MIGPCRKPETADALLEKTHGLLVEQTIFFDEFTVHLAVAIDTGFPGKPQGLYCSGSIDPHLNAPGTFSSSSVTHFFKVECGNLKMQINSIQQRT